jgi:hypothetical protein
VWLNRERSWVTTRESPEDMTTMFSKHNEGYEDALMISIMYSDGIGGRKMHSRRSTFDDLIYYGFVGELANGFILAVHCKRHFLN